MEKQSRSTAREDSNTATIGIRPQPGNSGAPRQVAEQNASRPSQPGRLKVGVALLGLDPSLADAIASHICEEWDPTEAVVFRGVLPESGFDCLLLVGDTRRATPPRVPITDVIEIMGEEVGPDSVPDVLLRIDAKLGRLTNSQLVLRSRKSYLSRGARLSRRDLLLGASKGFRGYSSFPFVFEDRCEAAYGCTRCVEACPTSALILTGRTMRVNEEACVRCGLCAAACHVGAVQLPEFSDSALTGLLDEIDRSPVLEKYLVLTCDSKAVSRRPGMVVVEVPSIGAVGRRQIVAAAATSVRGVGVVCPDGKCVGLDSANAAVEAVKASVGTGPSAPFLYFGEVPAEMESAVGLHDSSQSRRSRSPRSGSAWRDYISDLTTLLPPDSRASGLGLCRPEITDSCTLCGACVKACPHGALRRDEAHLYFSSSACTGCGACVSACPEKAIVLSDWRGAIMEVQGERECYEDEVAKCVRCGEPIGSARMVNRVSSLLGPENKLVRYCPSCKQEMAARAILGGRESG